MKISHAVLCLVALTQSSAFAGGVFDCKISPESSKPVSRSFRPIQNFHLEASKAKLWVTIQTGSEYFGYGFEKNDRTENTFLWDNEQSYYIGSYALSQVKFVQTKYTAKTTLLFSPNDEVVVEVNYDCSLSDLL